MKKGLLTTLSLFLLSGLFLFQNPAQAVSYSYVNPAHGVVYANRYYSTKTIYSDSSCCNDYQSDLDFAMTVAILNQSLGETGYKYRSTKVIYH